MFYIYKHTISISMNTTTTEDSHASKLIKVRTYVYVCTC